MRADRRTDILIILLRTPPAAKVIGESSQKIINVKHSFSHYVVKKVCGVRVRRYVNRYSGDPRAHVALKGLYVLQDN